MFLLWVETLFNPKHNQIMKTFSLVLPLTVLVSFVALGQKQSTKAKAWPKEERHIAINEFPTNQIVNHIEGWGSMTVAVNSLPKGTDFAPMLEGLKNNSCQVPHWGYIVQGILRVRYDNGQEVILKAGDLFYMSPGHVAKVEEDLKLLDFSPEDEFKGLFAHLEKKVAEQQKK